MNRISTIRLKAYSPVFIHSLLFFTAFIQNVSAQTPYCAPLYDSACTASNGFGVFIKSFNLKRNSTILLSDSLDCSSTSVGSLALNYKRDTSRTPSVTSGISYSFSIAFAESGGNATDAGYSIWIDLNNDFDFNDHGELMATGITGGNGNFTIPLATVAGNYRMRIRCRKMMLNGEFSAAIPSNACVTYESGSTLDYTLKIINCSVFTATATPVDASCNGGNNGSIKVTTIGREGALAFSKDNGATYTAGTNPFTFVNLPSSTYNIIVKDTNGCETAPKNVFVGQPTPLSINVTSFQNPTNCRTSNGSITITAEGGIRPYFFRADGGTLTTQTTFNGFKTGTHTFEVVDSNGCSAFISQNLILPNSPVINVISTKDVLCNGTSTGSIVVDMRGGVSPYNFSIDNGLTYISGVNPYTFNNLSVGNYKIAVLETGGCISATINATINQPSPIILTTTKTDETCDLSNGTVTVLGKGGTGNLNISCENCPTTAVSGIFSGLTSGNYRFSVVDSNLCKKLVDVLIDSTSIIPPSPVIALSQTICRGTSITLEPTGGTWFKFYTVNNINNNITYQYTGRTFSFIPEENTTVLISNVIGNCESATISTLVSIVDSIEPIAKCKAATIQLNQSGVATLTAEQIDDNSSDNCRLEGISINKTSFNCSNLGINTIILRAKDYFGNTSTCSTTVTVEDNNTPSVSCKPATIQLNASGNATLSIGQIDNNSTDNCSITQKSLSQTAFNCSNLGLNSVIFTATDAFGNTSTCVAKVIVEDKVNPFVFLKPATIQLDASGNATLSVAQIDNNSTDNCGITQRSLSKTSFNCSNLGTNTVIFTATDISGNSATGIATVTVEDKIAPSVSCKSATIQLNTSGNASLTINQIENNSTDNCGITQRALSKTTFDCSNLGTNIIIFSATDASGNTGTCATTVTVEDKVNPSVSCKPATVQLNAAGSATLSVAQIENTSSDNCGITQKTLSKESFDCTNLGTNAVIYTVTDASGNSATCSTTVTVADKIAPSVFCKSATIQLDATGNATLSIAQIDNNSTDNCGITQRSLSKTTFNCSNLGTNTVILTATDVSSNTSTCAATIIVQDKIEPTVVCKSATIQLDVLGNATLDIAQIDNNSTDNCGITQRSLSKTAFNCSNFGSNTVIFTATDISGNTATCAATITVEDNNKPSANCKSATVQLDAIGNGTLNIAQIDNNSTDNCGITQKTLSKTGYNCTNLGTNTVLFTVTDAAGNSATCSTTVRVEDKINPTATCKPAIIEYNSVGKASLTIADIDDNSTDNCGITQRKLSKTVFDCTNIGTNTVIFTATDASGNSSTCSTTVTVNYQSNPSVICKPATVQLNAAGIATLSVSQIDDNSTDNCGITQQVLSKTTFDCSNLGTNTVIFTVTYANGKTPTCSATVTVEDKITPSVSCKPTTIQLDATGNATLSTTQIDNNSTDNCGITQKALSKTTFDCSNLGTNTVVFTATDASGNAATCLTNVIVEDKVKPIALCKPATIQLDVRGRATLTTVLVDNNSTDNCGITQRLLSKTDFNCSNIGTNTVVFTAKDVSGNTSTCAAVVTVEDKIIPSVFCRSATIQLNAAGNATLTIDQIDNNSTDNCGISQRALSKTTFDCTNLGTNSVVFTTTDLTGNTSTCAAVVAVEDKITPSVFCKPVTIQLDATGKASLTAVEMDNNSTDNCGITQRSVSKTIFDCSNLGTNSVIFTATDASGNSATCSTTVTIEDKIAPSVVCKPMTIQFEANGKATLWAIDVDNNSTDNCGITQRSVSKTIFDCSNLGTNSVIFTATDASGNSATCAATVTVEYRSSPAVTCKPATVQLNAAGNGTLRFDQIDENTIDNCVISARSLSKTDFDCSNLGSNLVALTVTDVSGHSSTCATTVTVVDTVAPIVKCPANMIVQLSSGQCRIPLSFSATATDNCTISPTITQLSGIQSGELFDIGTFNTGFKAVDAFGNTASCTFSITVNEYVSSGGMACLNQINVNISPDCSTKILPELILLGNDNGCFEHYTVQLSTSGGVVIPSATVTSAHIGLTISAVVTSASGNSCSSNNIKILDNTPPTIQAPAPFVVNCTQMGVNGIPLSSVTGEPSIIQECSLPTTTSYNDQLFDVPCGTTLTSPPAGFPTDLVFNPLLAQGVKRVIVRTFTVADRYFNNSTTRQVIYIKPVSLNEVTLTNGNGMTCGNARTEPTDTIINGVTIQGTGYPVLPGNRNLNDNFCDIAAGHSDVIIRDAVNNTTTILRTWTIASNCTNELRTFIQTIVLRDAPPTLTLNSNTVLLIPVSHILTVNASTLISNLSDDCTVNNNMIYGIRIAGTGTGFPTTSSINFDCNQKGTYIVEIWVKDEGGNIVSKTTSLTVSDDGSKCPSISGMINREDMVPVPANIMLYGAANDSLNSTTGSSYFFKDLTVNNRFRVTPIRPNADWTNGVTMFDVALMSRHLLGVENITSPYRLIGADVNHNGEVDAVDMLLMQRLILHVTSAFANNNSWRFVLKSFQFDDPTNPFSFDFPESLLVPSLTSSIQNGDFVAIKVGDINLSAGALNIRGGMKPFDLVVEDIVLEKGKAYQIPIKLAPYQNDYNGKQISALQFALNIDKNVAQIENASKGDLPNCTDNNLGLFKNEGIVTAAWYRNPNQKFVENDSFTLFNLTIKPMVNTRLSHILTLNPSFTEGVVFDEVGNGASVQLSFGNQMPADSKSILLPNRPNPFSDETTLSFILPKAGFAKLTVCDLMGKVWMTTEREFSKGLNEVVFHSKNTPSVSSGIFIVRLQTQQGLVEQKIVLSR